MSITERRLTALLAGLLAVCLIAAASAAFLLGRRAAAAGQGQVPSASVPAPSSASASSSAPASSSSQASAPPVVSKPSSTAPSASKPSVPSSPSASASVSQAPDTAGTRLDPPVSLSAQVAKQSDGAAIQELVSLHFRSINTLDYKLWASTVTAEQSAALDQAAWLEAYRTSKDSAVKIVSIDPDTRWITVTFTSSQSVDKAPADTPSTCLNWKTVRPVVTVGGTLRLARTVEGLSKYSACG